MPWAIWTTALGSPSGTHRWVCRAVPSLAVTVVVVLCIGAAFGYL